MEFIDFFNKTLGATYATYDELPFAVEKMNVHKGKTITEYSQVEDSVYFINEGIVEMTIKSFVSEKVIDFFFENEMFCGFTSFLNQQPTDVQIITLIDCEIERIRREDLQIAYEHSLDANRFGRILTEQGYIRKSNREKELLTKTAEEKYQEMLHSHSKYISYIPVNKIAKYLGIHPESLSRIRKKMNS